MGHKIGGCEVAQTNSNTFLIGPGLPIAIFIEIEHIKNRGVTFWSERIGPLFPMLWSGHKFGSKFVTKLVTAP